jgi:hypothetical protein
MDTAEELLRAVRAELAPTAEDNPLVPLITAGTAPVDVLARLGAEEHRIVASDRRSFLLLAARAADPDGVAFFGGLGQGESLALATIPALVRAAGMDPAGLDGHRADPGCQAYSAYVAWLALNGEPAGVALAMLVNFAAWGGYCAAIAAGLREHYGFDDEACGFFDFFATPVPELERQGVACVQHALDAGHGLIAAREYARLLQSYEAMFWRSLYVANVSGPTTRSSSR